MSGPAPDANARNRAMAGPCHAIGVSKQGLVCDQGVCVCIPMRGRVKRAAAETWLLGGGQKVGVKRQIVLLKPLSKSPSVAFSGRCPTLHPQRNRGRPDPKNQLRASRYAACNKYHRHLPQEYLWEPACAFQT